MFAAVVAVMKAVERGSCVAVFMALGTALDLLDEYIDTLVLLHAKRRFIISIDLQLG